MLYDKHITEKLDLGMNTDLKYMAVKSVSVDMFCTFCSYDKLYIKGEHYYLYFENTIINDFITIEIA